MATLTRKVSTFASVGKLDINQGTAGSVLLLSGQLVRVQDLKEGQQGVLVEDASSEDVSCLSVPVFNMLNALGSSLRLRELYKAWYKKGGRKVEAELLRLLLRSAPANLASKCLSDRFQNVLRAAFETWP